MYNSEWHYHLQFILSGQDLLSYYNYYILVVIVDPVGVEDRAEVKAQHFVRTSGSLNPDSRANNQDQWSQRGTPVTTDQVSVHLQCPASSAVTETCMTAQMPVLPVAPVPEAPQPMDRDRKREGRWRQEEKKARVWWGWEGLFWTASSSDG